MNRTNRLFLVSLVLGSLVACAQTQQRPPRPLTGSTASSGTQLALQGPEQQVMMDLLQRVNTLSTEVQQLRNDAERNTHELDNLKTQEREMYLDIDRRLQQMEGPGGRTASTFGSSSSTRTTTSSSVLASPPRQPSPPASAPFRTPPPPAPSTASITRPPIVSQPPPVGSLPSAAALDGGELNSYNEAFNQLKAGQYPGAIAGFRRFLAAYPQSAYSGNAQYWLAEANYVSKDYPAAASEFTRVVQNYPQASKVADAKLKLGFTYYELGDYAKSRALLEEVRSRYPGSTVARLADQRLSRMSQEGR